MSGSDAPDQGWGDDNWSSNFTSKGMRVFVPVEYDDDDDDYDEEEEEEEPQASSSGIQSAVPGSEQPVHSGPWTNYNMQMYGNETKPDVSAQSSSRAISNSASEADAMLNDPALVRMMTIAAMRPMNVNDTARIMNIPLSYGRYDGKLADLPEFAADGGNRQKNKSVDPWVLKNRERQRKIEQIMAAEEDVRRKLRNAPQCRMSTGGNRRKPVQERQPPLFESVMDESVPDSDITEQTFDSEEPQTSKQASSSSDDPQVKRSYELTSLRLFPLGKSAGAQPEDIDLDFWKRRRLTTEEPVDEEPINEPTDDFTHEEDNLSQVDTEPTDDRMELTLELEKHRKSPRGRSRRLCILPVEWKSGKYKVPQSYLSGVEGELGVLLQPCACGVPPVTQLPSDIVSKSAEHYPDGRCGAMFRDENRNLKRCTAKVPEEERERFHWLPVCNMLVLLCDEHTKKLEEHKACPFCNEFYNADGKDVFSYCTGRAGNEVHLYHLDCRKQMMMEKVCPHCLLPKEFVLERPYRGRSAKITFHLDPLDFTGLADGLVTVSAEEVFSTWGVDGDDFLVHMTRQNRESLFDTLKVVQERKLTEIGAIADLLGMSVEDIDDSDSTALMHRAVVKGCVGAALIIAGSDEVDLVGPIGGWLLIEAISKKFADMIIFLVEQGAYVDYQDNDGRTVLHHAAYHESFDTVRYLLNNGADASVKDDNGFSYEFTLLPWITADQFYTLVLSGAINLLVLDRHGWTLLHWIAFLGRNDLVEFFMDNDVVMARDCDGSTPIHVAVTHQNAGFFEAICGVWKYPVSVQTPLEQELMKLVDEISDKSSRTRMLVAVSMYLSGIGFFGDAAKLNDVANRVNYVGEVIRDVSRGRAVVPIPAFDFTGKASFPEFHYSELNMKPTVFQFPLRRDRKSETWIPACSKSTMPAYRKSPKEMDESTVVSCEVAGCNCFRKAKESYCQSCQDESDPAKAKKLKTKGHRVHRIPRHGNLIALPAKKPLTVLHARNVTYRLGKKAETSSKQLAEDLDYICRLVQVSCLPEHRTRSRSESRLKLRTSRKKRTSSCPPRAPKNMRRLEECGRILEQSSNIMRERGILDETPSERQGSLRRLRRRRSKFLDLADDFSNATIHCPLTKDCFPVGARQLDWFNPLDLFNELHEFGVDELVEAAMLKFEQRWPLERWDLSAVVYSARRRHPAPPFQMEYSTSIQRKAQTKSDMDSIQTLEECSALCQCGPNCFNRFSHIIPRIRLALEWMGDKGWGVRALTLIRKGELCAFYTGEIYAEMENGLSLYNNDSYIFGLEPMSQMLEHPGMRRKPNKKDGEDGSVNISLDSKRIGTLSRFFNHSCDPNCTALPVISHGELYTKVGFWATRDIYPYEEVTINYGKEWWEAKFHQECVVLNNDDFDCRCGAPNCSWKTWKRLHLNSEVGAQS